jgi:hypothetical protein
MIRDQVGVYIFVDSQKIVEYVKVERRRRIWQSH